MRGNYAGSGHLFHLHTLMVQLYHKDLPSAKLLAKSTATVLKMYDHKTSCQENPPRDSIHGMRLPTDPLLPHLVGGLVPVHAMPR